MTDSINIKAPKFRGLPKEDFDTFLSQLKLRFGTTTVDPNDQAVILIECLQGEAARWVADKINRLKINEKVIPNAWADYDTLIQYLREQSGQHYNINETAEVRLHNIKQGKISIRDYNREFERIQSYLPDKWGSGSILYNYKRGLNRTMLEKLSSVPGSDKWDLATWMTNANGIERGVAHSQDLMKDYVPKQSNKGSNPQYVPMDVDRRIISGKKKRSNECYRCKKVGHFAKNCKNKPIGNWQRKPFNRQKRSKLDIVPEDEEEENSEDESIDQEPMEEDFQ